ncbi:MAG TPA: hypothetical protein ENH84_07510 [Phycisphaerae bacterium]|nr:hypothetical protein [Phycisphaerae bacterium]
MPEESPLVRQWILLRTLGSRHYGATVKELAEEMAALMVRIEDRKAVFLTCQSLQATEPGNDLHNQPLWFALLRWQLQSLILGNHCLARGVKSTLKSPQELWGLVQES